MTAIQLITGTVSGFVLVIDPNNENGKFEKIEYSDAAQMSTHVARLNREQVADYNANLNSRNWNPTETLYCTLYRRDDNGEVEQENGFDVSGKTNVGDPAYKAVCKCGKISWFKHRKGACEPTPSGTYTCEDCNVPDERQFDFSNYDDPREREY